jgi:hypothetical protein
MSKITQLPGTSRTPDTLLHQLLEHTDDMEGIIVTVMWKPTDETGRSADSYWSNMDASALVFLERCLGLDVSDFLSGPQCKQYEEGRCP